MLLHYHTVYFVRYMYMYESQVVDQDHCQKKSGTKNGVLFINMSSVQRVTRLDGCMLLYMENHVCWTLIISRHEKESRAIRVLAKAA